MKATLAILGFLATAAMAGPTPDDKYCKKVVYDPPQCPKYYPRDVELDERDDLEERDDLDERGDSLEERSYYPEPVCKKKCPKDKLYCTKWGYPKHPDFSGSFTYSVDCKKGKDYTVTGTIVPCPKGYGYDYYKGECLVVTYDVDYDKWPKNHKTSYVGVYDHKDGNPTELKKLNFNEYCKGDTCTIPLDKIDPYTGKLCGEKLWVGIDTGRCEDPKYYGYGYDKKYDPKDSITYVKLKVECTKECKAYCCNIGSKY